MTKGAMINKIIIFIFKIIKYKIKDEILDKPNISINLFLILLTFFFENVILIYLFDFKINFIKKNFKIIINKTIFYKSFSLLK